MNEKHDISNVTWRLHWVHWIIIVLSLVVTLSAWYISSKQIKEKQQNAFNRQTRQVVSLIEERMQKYEDALWGGAAFIQAVNHKIDQSSWKKYAKNLSLERKYPGINGIGVIYSMNAQEALRFQQQQRKRRSKFKIYPKHNNPRKIPIVYIEPENINKAAVGLDMAHEANRFNAAIMTEKTGKPHITGPITLVQDANKTPGFLLFVPIYKTNNKKQLAKIVYAPFIMNKLIQGTLARKNRDVALELSDSGTVLYSELKGKSLQSYTPLFKRSITEPMYGRDWVYTFVSTPMFDKNVKNSQPLFILFGGIMVDCLLIYLFITMSRVNRRAKIYADKVTRRLQKERRKYYKLAHNDSLSGLPNRETFIENINNCFETHNNTNSICAILLVSLSNIKSIKDAFGYATANNAIVNFSSRIKRLPAISTAHVAYAEFAILSTNIHSEAQLIDCLVDYINQLSQPMQIEGEELVIAVNMGVAVHKENEISASGLMDNADVALHHAKREGTNGYKLFTDELGDLLKQQYSINIAMQKAMEENEFSVVYQPQLSLSTKKLLGFEVLLRWQSKAFGTVPPSEFIPLAEESGYIIKLGQFVLVQSFADMQMFYHKTNIKDTILSVNASVAELLDKNYFNRIKRLMENNKFMKNNINLEVTESIFIQNIDLIVKKIEKIKTLGINFALDDFGTGYSSMNYLKNFAASVLKIDRSFVYDLETNENNQSIVKSIISLAHSLDIEVLAEGIETEAQYQFLLEEGCDHGQGFYFYQPMTIDEIIQIFKAG